MVNKLKGQSVISGPDIAHNGGENDLKAGARDWLANHNLKLYRVLSSTISFDGGEIWDKTFPPFTAGSLCHTGSAKDVACKGQL